MTHLKHLNKKMWNHVEEQTIFPFNLCRVILENPLFSSPVPLKSCVSSVLFLSGTEELAAEKLLSSPFRHSTLHFFVPRSGQFHFVILIAPYCTVLLISGEVKKKSISNYTKTGTTSHFNVYVLYKNELDV